MESVTGKHDSLNLARIAQITEQLYARRQFAYLCVGHSWQLQEVSDNLVDFGFAPMTPGIDVTDKIDFLVGIDTAVSLDLPMISSPTGIPIRATLIPGDSVLTVVVMDAREEFSQQKQLQQKANENQLLLDVQKKLMAELELTRDQLQSRNTQLQEATRLQSSFLSGVSHEFRTPLSSIIGYTNLLQRSPKNIDEKLSGDYLAAIKRSSKHLLSLIENLLDHGKFDSNEIALNPKITDLAELFNDVALLVQPLATTKDIEFQLKLNLSDNSSALVDDSRLRQCLINIVGNAIKFTDVGNVTVTVNWLDELLEVVVEDSGIGISNEHLDRIRQPFWQAPDTGKSGTGLGLTITERIIEMMGGSLNIESKPGLGTTVSFHIVAPHLGNAIESAGEFVPKLNKSLRVLLAEDDQDIANLVVLLLEEQGAHVTHVLNGALAVDSVQNHLFDLALIDLHMPIMNGFAAVQEIRKIGSPIPIIIMTASAIEDDRRRAEQLECDGYLVKPVDVSDLISIANQILS